MTKIYGNIILAADRVSPTYCHPIGLAPDAAVALSQFWNGDDRAAGLNKIFVRTRHDADHIVRVAAALTGRLSATMAA